MPLRPARVSLATRRSTRSRRVKPTYRSAPGSRQVSRRPARPRQRGIRSRPCSRPWRRVCAEKCITGGVRLGRFPLSIFLSFFRFTFLVSATREQAHPWPLKDPVSLGSSACAEYRRTQGPPGAMRGLRPPNSHTATRNICFTRHPKSHRHAAWENPPLLLAEDCRILSQDTDSQQLGRLRNCLNGKRQELINQSQGGRIPTAVSACMATGLGRTRRRRPAWTIASQCRGHGLSGTKGTHPGLKLCSCAGVVGRYSPCRKRPPEFEPDSRAARYGTNYQARSKQRSRSSEPSARMLIYCIDLGYRARRRDRRRKGEFSPCAPCVLVRSRVSSFPRPLYGVLVSNARYSRVYRCKWLYT